ncbi:MAG: glycerate kinase [bacterium]
MSVSKLRQDAIDIFNAGLKAANPKAAVLRFMTREGQNLAVDGRMYYLADFENIYVVGAGKAGASMAQAVEEIVGDRITAGLLNVKYGHTEPLQKVKICEAGHPVPDEAGLAGAKEIIRLLHGATEKDLILCLLSGGGSALLPLPADDITLEQKQAITQALLACGATINEMNAVRKHISKIKGGQLAQAAHPAVLITLILSDVVGDCLDVIASGPTVADLTSFSDAKETLERYDLWERTPGAIKKRISRGVTGEAPENPKPDDEIFTRVQNVIVGNNQQALLAAEVKAQDLGYHTLILSSFIEGETREVARVHSAIAKEIQATGNPLMPPACVISGGETTVTIRGHGKGGRNQEFALAAAIGIDGLENVVILSAGTDGTDGPTDAAGALCDGKTACRAKQEGRSPGEHLTENNAYAFFEALGDLLITGPTNTNVMDLRLVLVGPA